MSQSHVSREPANQPRPQLSHQTLCLSPAPTPILPVGLTRDDLLPDAMGDVDEDETAAGLVS